MGIELATGRMNPSAALDELESIAQSIQDKALDLTRRAVNADTSKYAKKRRRRYLSSLSSQHDSAYAGQWLLSGDSGSYNPHSTIRLFSNSPAAFAVDDSASSSGWGGAGSFSAFTPVSDLVVGYTSAVSYAPASSESSSFSGGDGSSGYSGSSFSGGYDGGGFSGAGSSSSF